MSMKFYDEVILETVNKNRPLSAVNVEYVSGVIDDLYEAIPVSQHYLGNRRQLVSSVLPVYLDPSLVEIRQYSFDSRKEAKDHFLIDKFSLAAISGIKFTVINPEPSNPIIGLDASDLVLKSELQDLKDIVSGQHQWLPSVGTLADINTAYPPTGSWRKNETSYLVHSVNDQNDYELTVGDNTWELFNDKSDYVGSQELTEFVSGSIYDHNEDITAHGGITKIRRRFNQKTEILSSSNPVINYIDVEFDALPDALYTITVTHNDDTLFPIITNRTTTGFRANFKSDDYPSGVNFTIIG